MYSVLTHFKPMIYQKHNSIYIETQSSGIDEFNSRSMVGSKDQNYRSFSIPLSHIPIQDTKNVNISIDYCCCFHCKVTTVLIAPWFAVENDQLLIINFAVYEKYPVGYVGLFVFVTESVYSGYKRALHLSRQ